jgi:hypothetical protein
MLWRPDALSGVIGTTVGATVLMVLLLIGLRDLLGPDRTDATGEAAAP